MKPSGFDIYLKYACDCGYDHWLTLEEAKGHYTIVCAICKKRHEITPVDSVKALINFKKCTKKTNKMASLGVKPASFSVVEEAYGILKNYNFSRQELERANIVASNSQEFVKEFLARQK